MNLVTLKDWSAEEVAKVLEVSLAMKADPERFDGTMQCKNLALLFQKTSTRTRCSGEIGMSQLGGQAIYLDWRSSNFGLADLGDEIRVLGVVDAAAWEKERPGTAAPVEAPPAVPVAPPVAPPAVPAQ